MPLAAGKGGAVGHDCVGSQHAAGVRADHVVNAGPLEEPVVVLAEDHRPADLGHLVEQGLVLDQPVTAGLPSQRPGHLPAPTRDPSYLQGLGPPPGAGTRAWPRGGTHPTGGKRPPWSRTATPPLLLARNIDSCCRQRLPDLVEGPVFDHVHALAAAARVRACTNAAVMVSCSAGSSSIEHMWSPGWMPAIRCSRLLDMGNPPEAGAIIFQ